jgi:hypothetical protein
MSKYEQLIEYIINEQEDKARELFHQIVVEKSRDIYESLIDEQDLEEVGGNEVESMVDEITGDEEGMQEAEDDMGDDEEDMDAGDDMGDDEEDMDMDAGDDMGGDDDMGMGGGDDMENRVMDLEDALDELKAEFDALMGGGDDMGMDGDDMGMDDGMGMGDEGDEDMGENLIVVPTGETNPHDMGDYDESVYEAKKSKKEEMLKDKMLKDKKAKKMTEAEWIREYVEKIGEPFPGKNTETGEVGAGGTASLNTKSIVAGKNDMGGTASNIAKGGAESDPSGTPNKKPSGLLKGGQDLIGKVQNSPGANAGKSAYKSKAPSVAKNEVGGINDKSPLAK